ncbi:MAG TPA: M23 family metallopeptidase, partial [Candidatus Mucispirillum faecigallinarum]|nr:M23 family metallopeptidase [Candidatus Mucispirillum faecigallinarum]
HLVADAGVKIMHKGIKISPEKSENAKSVADGKVVFADNVKNFNNLVIIDHGSSYYTVYGNMDTLRVAGGQKVRQGDILGDIIVDEAVDNPYLYFELRKKEKALNPNLWFKKG